MKYYVTKYALTDGILLFDQDQVHLSDVPEFVDTYIYVGRWRRQISKNEWFLTLEEAQARVDQKVAAKIKSLEKSIKKFKSYQARVQDYR